MAKYRSIADVKKACESGEIDESKLEIVMDNDDTGFYYGERDEDGYRPCIFNGEGYHDIEKLYPLVFPKADVGWC